MTPSQATVKTIPMHYDANVHCSLIGHLCTFAGHGPDARVHAINHCKETGHTVICRVQATEEIRPL